MPYDEEGFGYGSVLASALRLDHPSTLGRTRQSDDDRGYTNSVPMKTDALSGGSLPVEIVSIDFDPIAAGEERRIVGARQPGAPDHQIRTQALARRHVRAHPCTALRACGVGISMHLGNLRSSPTRRSAAAGCSRISTCRHDTIDSATPPQHPSHPRSRPPSALPIAMPQLALAALSTQASSSSQRYVLVS